MGNHLVKLNDKNLPKTPLLTGENKPAPPLKQRSNIAIPKEVPELSHYSFPQEVFIRLSMPTVSGVSTMEQLKSGDIKSISITYHEGLYFVGVIRKKVK